MLQHLMTNYQVLRFRGLEKEPHQAESQTSEEGANSIWLVLVFLSLKRVPVSWNSNNYVEDHVRPMLVSVSACPRKTNTKSEGGANNDTTKALQKHREIYLGTGSRVLDKGKHDMTVDKTKMIDVGALNRNLDLMC